MDKSLVEALPPMLNGNALDEALRILPHYDESIKNQPVTTRLVALQDIYSIYTPSLMSREIYSRLYLALVRSMQKKQTILAIRQHSENSKRIRQQTYESIIGGADCFTIIGSSGIGKTSAISRATSILMENPIIEMNGCNLITCLAVQCPADASIKGLLLEILRKTDEVLNSRYYSEALRAKSTIDVLIGTVSQVAQNHIGLMVIDEIQNVISNKSGKSILGTLTQLINNAGISIIMVGTPDCEVFFASEMVLARRSAGLTYSEMSYGKEYVDFIKTLLKYTYTKSSHTDEALSMWLYSHTRGNRALTVQLIHDSQEIAIMDGSECLDISSLKQAYERRMALLHDYINPERKTYSSPKKTQKQFVEVDADYKSLAKVFDISLSAKRANADVITKLRENGVSILEVSV